MGGEGHVGGEMVCGEHKAVFLYIQGHQQDRARLLSGMHAGRTRKNCVKFKQEFQIGCLLQAFSPMRTAKQWHRFPREVVQTLSLETLLLDCPGLVSQLILL